MPRRLPAASSANSLFPVDEVPAPAPVPVPARLYVDVAVNRPMRCEFTYRVPAELEAFAAPGVRVEVPFGPRREIGVVVGLRTHTDLPPKKVKPIAKVLDREPLVDAGLMELTRWIATYYACSWGEALSAALPSALKHGRDARLVTMIELAPAVGAETLAAVETSNPKQFRLLRTLREINAPIELRDLCRRVGLTSGVARTLEMKGFVRISRVEVSSDPLVDATAARPRPATLSPDQQRAFEAIERMVASGQHATYLLQGITGSGKTEVYLRVIESALALGKGAIVIVPEIALTPQTVGWFRSRFGAVGVLHSRMTDAQRRETWLRVKHGEARVVVGARSAVFAPVQSLGVIVVDEEHEPSYKQSDVPRYHARDVAVMRAKQLGGVCVLGSATPSLESWHEARTGNYQRLMLRERVSGGTLPRVEIVDLRNEKGEGRGPVLFSQRLKQLLTGALARGEQSILFQNRRGFAPVLWCGACRETVRCKNCDVSLTFHKRIRRAACHSCGEEIVPPTACPSCTAPALHYLGAGSERVEAALSQMLPTARVRRMDSDTMLRREDYEEVLASFGRGEIDVLVGTQMIAKGLDFPRVTVVGIVSADGSLHQPDFRASERTFQLLAQVSGRAGRGVLKGEIVVQTGTPAHPAILCAAKHDYEGFIAAESRLRAELGYPPHGKLLRVVFEDADESQVAAAAKECGELLRKSLPNDGTLVLGPAEAPIALQRGRHRHHLIVKSPANAEGISKARELLMPFADARARPRITIDVDPASMM
jgi:primosomal protein N' (replication factor Y)